MYKTSNMSMVPNMSMVAAVTLSVLLSGCEWLPRKVVTETVYVTTRIPADHLVIPEHVEPIDVQTATQRDVSNWLVKSEKRTVTLENQIRAIDKLQTDFIKGLETKK